MPIVMMGPMMVGLFGCLFEKQARRPFEFGLLFKGFDHFVPGLIVTAIKIIPILIIMVPFYFIMVATMMATMPRGQASPEDMSRFMSSFFGLEMIFILIIMVVSIGIEVFFMFAYPLVADRKLSGLDAVKLSIKRRQGKLWRHARLVGVERLIESSGLSPVLCRRVPAPADYFCGAVRRLSPRCFQNWNNPLRRRLRPRPVGPRKCTLPELVIRGRRVVAENSVGPASVHITRGYVSSVSIFEDVPQALN